MAKIRKLLENDHSNLESLGADVLGGAAGPDVGGRDNQFDLYDLQLRRHLAVVEDVFLPPLKTTEAGKATASDIHAQHKELRAQLKALDRSPKDAAWAEDFRTLQTAVSRACDRHDGLVQQAEAAGAADLAGQYERAQIKRLHGAWSFNKVGLGLGAAAAAAGLAGAAFAASRYYRSGRRATGRNGDDFELRLETDENLRLIASSKVEGTPVVGRDGESLGRIESFMVDKYTGRVAYAVMSFGGVAGFGKSLFPLPWPLLDYDEAKDGYALDITKDEMAEAPRFQPETEPDWTPQFRREILVFYRPLTADADTANTAGAETPTPANQSAKTPESVL